MGQPKDDVFFGCVLPGSNYMYVLHQYAAKPPSNNHWLFDKDKHTVNLTSCFGTVDFYIFPYFGKWFNLTTVTIFFRWVESTQIIFRCKSLEKKEPETTAEALKNDLSKMVIVIGFVCWNPWLPWLLIQRTWIVLKCPAKIYGIFGQFV